MHFFFVRSLTLIKSGQKFQVNFVNVFCIIHNILQAALGARNHEFFVKRFLNGDAKFTLGTGIPQLTPHWVQYGFIVWLWGGSPLYLLIARLLHQNGQSKLSNDGNIIHLTKLSIWCHVPISWEVALEAMPEA
jgi:hypothetical protein